tara:strand:- start:481 stop:813 length:333 start_codon:yes stop_codon:yes gene_type:complete
MAFIRRKSKAYPWPVEINRPSETNAGEFDTETFTIKFKRLNRKELDGFTEAQEDKALEKIVLGWSEISEEDGTEIPFTKANLKEFSEDVDFVNGVVTAFQKFYTEGKEGN